MVFGESWTCGGGVGSVWLDVSAKIDGMLKALPEACCGAYAPSIRRNVVELVVSSMAQVVRVLV